MITSQDFYEQLQEGEEVVTLHLRKPDFLELPNEVVEKGIFTIREQHSIYKDDIIWSEWNSKVQKAKKERRKREQDINHGSNKV